MFGSDAPFREARKELQRFCANVSQSVSLPKAAAPGERQDQSHSLVVGPDDRFAALSFGKVWRWGRGLFRRRRRYKSSGMHLPDEIKSMSEEQREKIRRILALHTIHQQRPEHDGKRMSMPDAIQKIDEALLKLKRSVGIDTLEELSKKYNYLDLLHLLPTEYLRRDAPKQQLLGSDEQQLELTRLTSGVCDKGIWGGQEYAFGIFGREDVLMRRMQNWRLTDPSLAVENQHFFTDLMSCSGEAELTLMVVPRKKLSIRQLQWEYYKKLSKIVAREGAERRTFLELVSLMNMFNPTRLQEVAWVEGTRVVPDTQFLFSTRDLGKLVVEVVSPGPLNEQKTTYLGTVEDPHLFTAVFDLFLGDNPIDAEAKLMMADNVRTLGQGEQLDFPPANVVAEMKAQQAKQEILEIRRMERMKFYVTKTPPAHMTPFPKRDASDFELFS